MRAAVITEPGGPDVLKIMEVDDPTPGPEDILIDVKAWVFYTTHRNVVQKTQALQKAARDRIKRSTTRMLNGRRSSTSSCG